MPELGARVPFREDAGVQPPPQAEIAAPLASPAGRTAEAQAGAGREVLEEVGLRLASIEHVASGWTMPGISTEQLRSRLNRMVADGMLPRQRYREVPPRVAYELTERARAGHFDSVAAYVRARTLGQPEPAPATA